MSSPTTETIRWTIADLELFPDDGKRYEIIDGELLVTRAPHWRHQKLCVRIGARLDAWSQETGLGEAAVTPGIIFSEADNVIPAIGIEAVAHTGYSLGKRYLYLVFPELPC